MGLLTEYLYKHHPRVARYRKYLDTALWMSWWVALFFLYAVHISDLNYNCLQYNMSMFKLALINSNCSIPYNITLNLSASFVP